MVRQSYLHRADFATHHLQRLQRRQGDKIFNAFFTTKPNGIGIGTSHQPMHPPTAAIAWLRSFLDGAGRPAARRYAQSKR